MIRIKEKVQSLSKWFKVCFCILFVVYVAFWFFSIHLSAAQKSQNIKPVLPVMYQDSHEYADLAQSLIHQSSFAQDGQLETFRVPGYPFFVAVIYLIDGYFLVTFVQIILVFISALLIREIGIIFSGKKVGEIAAVFFLLNPVVLILSLIILTDILFLFLFLLGFYLAVSIQKEKLIGKVILASVIFSCAIYVRPIGLFALPVFIAPFLVSKISLSDKIKSVCIMILIVLISLTPWIMRNYKLTGVADFSSSKSMNFAFYYVPMFLSNKNGTTVEAERLNIEKATNVPIEDWRNLHFSPVLSSITDKIILNNPFSYIKYHILASTPFLFSSSVQEAIYTYRSAMMLPVMSEDGVMRYLLSGQFKLFFQGVIAVWWKMAERIFLLFMYAVAIFGLWKNRKNKMSWLLVFTVFYLMLLSGPVANVRLAVQSFPFILLLFASGLATIYKYKKI
jgi:4-amino-4-deoxy-L-arabinose transferase-like glycosyltransferase